jgi:hypothetical protein
VSTKTPSPMIMARTRSGNTNTPRPVHGKGNMVRFQPLLRARLILLLQSSCGFIVLRAFGQTAGARDSSSSYAGVQPCEDCFLPSQRVAHLCLRCYRSRRDCRTCRERCSPYKVNCF